MKELSLFSGAGGGLLGTKLLGWNHIGYVEYNDYCQRVIRQRIIDGILDNAPIFGDIRTFISEGYAASYTGMVDVITGGFPCQPFSSSGDLLGEFDPRNMWPSTIGCIRIVRPRYALLENVSNLLTFRYFGTILSDLAAAGYDARWCVLSACAFGASHTRERLFILAYPKGIRGQWRGQYENGGKSITQRKTGERLQCRTSITRHLQTTVWDTTDSAVLRIPNGLGSKVDRLSAIGNGQVPIVAATAWRLLSEGIA